jgi:hypothetical protein
MSAMASDARMSENPIVNLAGILFPLVGLIKIPRSGIQQSTYRTLRIISAPNVPSESYNALSVSKNNTGIKK